MKRLVQSKDRQKELDKIHLDEIKNYEIYEKEEETNPNDYPEYDEEEYRKQLEEDAKRGRDNAEEVAKKYNLPNSYNADSIEEPHLREYVQALLTYYNSWADYDDGYTKFCERRLDAASDALYNYQQSLQK